MRDRTKVIMGLGSIWGLFAFGSMTMTSFTSGSNDSAVEIAALVLYGFWHPRFSGIWLLALSVIAAFGFLYQGFHQAELHKTYISHFKNSVGQLVVAAIPAFIGYSLVRSERTENVRTTNR